MNPLLPAALVCGALGLAFGAARPAVAHRGLLLFALFAALAALAPEPATAGDTIRLGCWIGVIANAASIYLRSRTLVLAAAVNTGVWLGALSAVSHSAAPFAAVALLALSVPLRRVHAAMPIVSRVLSSWLLAVAALALLLGLLVATPGYVPDHLE